MGNRILIVDDEPNMLQAIEIILSDEGFDINICGNGSDAIGLIRKNSYKCVLSDIKMPEMDGIELTRRIKEIDPDIPIILMTAYATVETAVDALRQGVFDYIFKPFEPEHLVQLIKKAAEFSHLKTENLALRTELANTHSENRIVGKSRKMIEAQRLITKVAASDATVLISGESGSGKELAAFTLHSQSLRNNGPFITLNCTAIPDSLIESEFFGAEKGSFTGAHERRKGKFELAHGGTIFLDEIGDMKYEMQSKLLRVLQEKKVQRIGGSQDIEVDVRIIAATNINLKEAVADGRFREDLFFRLNVFPIVLPPLRERKEDIPELTRFFVERYSLKNRKEINGVTEESLAKLTAYHWPGNIRELSNVIERAVIICDGKIIKPVHIELSYVEKSARLVSLEEAEQEHIRQILEHVGGKKTEAAEILKIDRSTLYRLCKKYGF